MDPSDAHDRVRTIFNEQLHIDPPEEEADLVEAGILDSLTFVSLLVSLEEDLGVRVALENIEIEDFNSIAKIAAFVVAHKGRKDS